MAAINTGAPSYSTGGPLPPDLQIQTLGGAPTTGGNLPPLAVNQGPITGGNLPPTPVPNPVSSPIIGQNYVATATPNATQGPSAAGTIQGINDQFAAPQLQNPTTQTLDSLNQILGSGSPYLQNAVRRGLETAGARGLLNSSIAAGASQRSAIEAATPILGQAMNLNNQREAQNFQAMQQSRNNALNLLTQREQNAFNAQESQLNRTQGVNDQLLAAELRRGDNVDKARIQNWLDNESFTRQFNGALRMLPIKSAADLTATIAQLAAQDPELYTPTVISGMTQFFNNNMISILQQYFPEGGA